MAVREISSVLEINNKTILHPGAFGRKEEIKRERPIKTA